MQYVPYQCTLSHLVTQLWLCVSALPTTKQLINAFGVLSRSTVEYLAAHLNRFVFVCLKKTNQLIVFKEMFTKTAECHNRGFS